MEFAASNAPQRSSLTLKQTHSADSNTDRDSAAIPVPSAPASSSETFWKKYPGLVWSNRQAGDDVRIRAALMKPRFPVLLDIAVTFGLERLEQEWAILRADPETDTQRVEPLVSPILTNIRRGYEQACG